MPVLGEIRKANDTEVRELWLELSYQMGTVQ